MSSLNHRRRATLLVAFLVLAVAGTAHATTYNSPTVDDGLPPSTDGVRDPSWEADEWLANDLDDGTPWGPFNQLDGFWVTWDQDGIYFSVTGALWDTASGVGANAVNLYIDVDHGQGTGSGDMSSIDPESLGAVSRNFSRTFTVGGGFGVDWGYTCWGGGYDLGFLDVRDPVAPVNLFDGVSDAASVITHTSAEGVIESRDIVGNGGYELFVPWSVFYPDEPAGQVPVGTQVAVVVAQVGGGDSLSPESMPDDLGDRAIDAPIVFTVDADGNGVPDQDWPPSGTISGTVTLDDPLDTTTQVDVVALLDGIAVARSVTPPGGGVYSLVRLGPGSYEVVLESTEYFADPVAVDLAEGEDRVVDILAEKINSGVDLSLAFTDGPEAVSRTLDVVVEIFALPSRDKLWSITLAPADALDLRVEPVRPGDYEMVVRTEAAPPIGSRTGYDPLQFAFSVQEDQYTDLGQLDLSLVQPTRLLFSAGDSVAAELTPVTSTRVSESLPAQNFFSRRNVVVTLVDEDGDEALLDLAARAEVQLSATDIDPRFPVSGSVDYWTFDDDSVPVASAGDTPTLDQLDPVVSMPTRAIFRFSSDTRQVLRFRATHPTLGIHELEAKITPRLPAGVSLSLAADTAIAGEEVEAEAQLLDVSGDDSQTADVVIRFEVLGEAGQGAGFTPSEVKSQTDGSVGRDGSLRFRSTVAGRIPVRASFEIQQQTILSAVDTVVVSPSPPDRIGIEATQVAGNAVEVTVGLEDEFGNVIPGVARTIDIGVGPDDLVSSFPGSVDLTADGTVTFEIAIPESRGGILEISATDAGLPTPTTTITLETRAGLAARDEEAPESDPLHNSIADMDLTSLYVSVVRDTLEVTLPFTSTYGGVHVTLLLEVEGDAEGAFNDPFTFPISYAHTNLPDYVLTYKYSADDYGDLRRQAGPPGSWEWYNFQTRVWTTGGGGEEGVNAKAEGMMGRTLEDVFFRIPIRSLKPDFVSGTDEVNVEAYLMQEDGGAKRPAFDSVPADDTLDLDDPIPWDSLPGMLTTLRNYAPVVPAEIGTSLRLTESIFSPTLATQGETVLLTTTPSFETGAPPSPVIQVFADLSANFGGDALTPMVDDGTGGDATAGDGIYSTEVEVPVSLLAGEYAVTMRALEVTTSQQAFDRATLAVEGEPQLTPLLTLEDAIGDDHGPNREGEQFLYYTYPTSGVFFDGVFDLSRVEVFDVGDRLLFRVQIADLTNPAEQGAADWNAVYPSDDTCPAGSRVDLNLQNIVILLDTEEGNGVGSTDLPDNRRAGVAGQDAWEYALVYDGWWKGVVASNGSSQQAEWETFPNDSDWFFCANDQTNTIDGFLNKSVLGDVTEDDIRSWDIIVLLSGHDGDSNRDNWGGVRWVNEGTHEWQFGGGRNGEGNSDRDPNVMDILTRAGVTLTGTQKEPGLAQEDQMDFLTADARVRFAEGENAVLFEATDFTDLTPPSVQWIGLDPARGPIPWRILQDGPVVVRANLLDDSEVTGATMYWRTAGQTPGDAEPVPMGNVRSDLGNGSSEWVADLRWEEVRAATENGPNSDPSGLSDDVRYIYVSIDAEDEFGNTTASAGDRVEEALELPLEPVTEITYADLGSLLGAGIISVDLDEGSRLTIGESLAQTLAPDSSSVELGLRLRAVAAADVDFSFTGSRSESILGGGDRYLGIVRQLELFTIDAGDSVLVETFPEPVELSLHFPRYVMGDADPWELQFFRWNESTRRWILVGAHGETSGTTITANVNRLGTYAAFVRGQDVDTDEIVTGLQVSPNPFSPNGDGLYDELNITWVLPDETESTIVEIFDKRGTRFRTLSFFGGDGVIHRTLGATWDGKDDGGREVPRGIYIVRVESRDSQDNRVGRATEAVAVIR